MQTTALDHIPNLPGLPVLGHTPRFLRDPEALILRSKAACGPFYKLNVLNRWRVVLDSPAAVRYVLRDPEQVFSSEQGGDVLHPIFTGGLAARDFDDHRQHRRIMQSAFRAPAMRGYIRSMIAEAGPMVGRMPADLPFPFATEIKKGLLQMGGNVFLGLDVEGADLAALNRDFIRAVAGCLGIVRKPLPLTRMRRGIEARDRFAARLRALIPERRRSGGQDFFSQMCAAEDSSGAAWSDEEIVQHFSFLLLAGHDTTASGLTTLVWGIGAGAPDWQERLIAEVDDVAPDIAEGLAAGDDAVIQAALGRMVETERAFEEALRFRPPVPFLSRRALRATGGAGVPLPADTTVMVPLASTMRDPDAFPEPDRFDPARTERGAADLAAFSAFGGGAHKCIGLHFAYAQTKIVVAALLSRYRVQVLHPDPDWALLPITRPRDGLPIRLHRRQSRLHAP